MTATTLFVHGSFMSGWCWLPVIERLERDGVDCRTIDLPFTSLTDDVDTLKRRIDELVTSGPVTVVCHSYSGITTSLAAHAAERLVFVAARLPRPNESPMAISSTWGSVGFRECISESSTGASVLDPRAEHLLFNRSPRGLARVAIERLRPMRSEIPVEPIDDPAWMSVSTTYVVCTDDLVVDVDQQRERATLVNHAIEIDCDHSPFFSAPDRLAEVIRG
jgi:pimeloyl-ACP methyl ester carboxylesterase